MSSFVQGATMLGSFAIAVFFLRYWRQTGDRLFGVFAFAFTLFGVNRIVLASLETDSEARTWVYLLRALMFIAIIGAIIDKNVERHDR
jgi:glucose uptake protein GlcU